MRKAKPGDRNFVDLANYGEESRIARLDAERLKRTRDKARTTVEDFLTGKGAQEAKQQLMYKKAEEKLNAYRSEENRAKRAAELRKQGRDQLKDVWALEVYNHTPSVAASKGKPEDERTAADVVCIHLSRAYEDYQTLKSLEPHALITDQWRKNTELKNDAFEKFKKNLSVAYTTMRLYQPNALMFDTDMFSVGSTASRMCMTLTKDFSKADQLGGNLLRKSGTAEELLQDLDTKGMNDLDSAFTEADPTSYVTGRTKKGDDFLENKPMTRADRSESLRDRAAKAMAEYKPLKEYHPAGKPITEEMALARNIAAYCCVADKVLTQMYPTETDAPDMNIVRGQVNTLLKNPDFVDQLSNVKLDSNFSSQIETLCKEGPKPEKKQKPRPTNSTKPTLG